MHLDPLKDFIRNVVRGSAQGRFVGSGRRLARGDSSRKQRAKAGREFAASAEILESRQLLAGPQLINVAPNTGGFITSGQLRTEAPRELLFTFSPGATIDPDSLVGISVSRAGGDGQIGSIDDLAIQLGHLDVGPLPNQVTLRFADSLVDDLYRIQITGDLTDTTGQAFNNGQTQDIDFRIDFGGQVVSVVPQPVLRATVLTVADATSVADGDLVTVTAGSTPVVFEFHSGSPALLANGNIPVEYEAGDSATVLAARLGAAINAASLDQTSPLYKLVSANVSGDQVEIAGSEFSPLIGLTLNSAGFLTTANGAITQAEDTIVVYFNQNPLNPALAGDAAFYQVINTADGSLLLPQFVRYDAVSHTAVLQFSTILPAGTYHLQIGAPVLRNNLLSRAVNVGTLFANTGSFETVGYLGDGGGSNQNFNEFDLFAIRMANGNSIKLVADEIAAELGGEILLRVFDATGQQVPGGVGINTLDVAGLQTNRVYYVGVSSVGNAAYDPVTGTGAAGGTGTGSYKLRMGTSSLVFPQNDTSSFGTATGLGTLGAGGFNIQDSITPPNTVAFPPLPGGNDEPGHRQLPIEGESNDAFPGQTPTFPGAIPTQYYNFSTVYGTDPQGNTLFNAITEAQKQRTREIFEMYGRYLGIEFVETDDAGPARYHVVTGDPRAVSPGVPPTAVGGITNGSLIVMNGALDWGVSEYGGGWFGVAFHEIGHALGLSHSYDSPSTMGGGLGGVEPVYPGDVNLVPAMRLNPPLSTDVNLYRFQLEQSGDFTAETVAQRIQDQFGTDQPSMLDSLLTLYRETYVAATVTSDFGTQGATGIKFTARTAGVEGNAIQLVISKASLGVSGPTIGVNGNQVTIVLNTSAGNATTAQELVDALNNHVEASALLQASLADVATGGVNIAAPTINYSPIKLVGGATNRSVVARNDDYFGRDSLVNLHLDAGVYYVAVSSTGNSNFDPAVPGTGYGGRTDGEYRLQLRFDADPLPDQTLNDARGVAFDGDLDHKTGGVFHFWFQTGSTIFVDKANAGDLTQDGSVAHPFGDIATALASASAGMIVRIVGNGGADGDVTTADDNLPYLIGFDSLGGAAEDGSDFIVPQGVTVMIDEGAIFKLSSAVVDVGKSVPNIDRSGAALQVLGTPGNRVRFTSLGNDGLGGRSDSNDFNGPERGDWGGLVFRQFSDFQGTDWQGRGVFLNSVNQAELTYGGGQVFDDSVLKIFTPIHIENLDADQPRYARPNIWFNTITESADAAISADPNSFANTGDRSGPHVRGNQVIDNTVNGFFIRVRTDFGQPIDKLELPARIDDTDITYVLPESLFISGNAGGPYFSGETGLWDARVSGSLVLDPGVILKLSGARIQAEVGSSQFVAEGTEALPVVLTSLRDDTWGAGGSFDTGSDADAPVSRGDWAGISFSPNSAGSIDHAVIQYAGGVAVNNGDFASFNPIEVLQADVRITNTLFQQNDDGTPGGDREGLLSNGSAVIFVRGSQPVIVGNTFQSNTGNVISVNANALNSLEVRDWGRSTSTSDAFSGLLNNTGPLVAQNLLADNSTNGMEVRAERITTETIWDDADIVHVVRGEIIEDINRHTFGGIRLQSSPESSLVVKLDGPNAGFTVTGTPLDIDDRIGGTLQVIGSSQYPVVFTAVGDDTIGAGFRPDGLPQTDTNNNGNRGTLDAVAGAWRSLRLDRYSNDRNAAVALEVESLANTAEQNGTAATAQFLGSLAPQIASDNANDTKGGNDYQPYAYEVHGFLGRPSDVDVYSFTANRNTEVWLDISRTSSSLDTVVELIDASGNVLASSNDSQNESRTGTALTMSKNSFLGEDFYTANPRDAGMRVVLTGASTVGTYFVRVRSSDGLTAGQYNLQVRIRQLYEAPGSTIRYADVRYATNGIEVLGLPNRSPLSGEATETPANNSPGSATSLGNLLESDMNTLSVSGTLADQNQVDWYRFRLQYDLIQSIGGVNGGGKTWSTIFDIDYADGLVRADSIISVFDAQGNLILVSRDSNISDDQPGPRQGNGLKDLSRGSVGKLDPFIGSVQMPAGTPNTDGFDYFVAISSNAQLPTALNATFQSGSGSPLVRLEPVNSVKRIVEDHVGFTGHRTGRLGDSSNLQPEVTSGVLPIASIAELSTTVRPLTLADLTLYAMTTGSRLVAVNPSTGQQAYDINEVNAGNGFFGSIKMRSDGVLYGYRATTPGAADNAGTLVIIDPTTGAETTVGVDAIPDFDPATNPPDPNELTSDAVDSFAFVRTGASATAPEYNLYYAVTDPFGLYNGGNIASRLYRANPANGSAAVVDGQPWGVRGEITFGPNDATIGRTTGMASLNGLLYGVSSTGMFYTISQFSGRATLIKNFTTPFTSLTEGPKNLANGAFANLLFATTSSGTIICFDTAGNVQGVFAGNTTSAPFSSVRGITFSPLDVNLWHPTERRTTDAGHGINDTFDNSREHMADFDVTLPGGRESNQAQGGASFYFGLEEWSDDPDAANRYLTYGGINAQYGFESSSAHFDLASNAAVGDNYNLPGGAMGSLITNPFSLVGYQSTDKPTLYFNYFLQSENANSITEMRDSARVYIFDTSAGLWRQLATNNSILSQPLVESAELPAFLSTSSAISAASNQRVQELFDNTNGWRQARIDLGDFAGQANLQLRFDFSTAGAALAGNSTQAIQGDQFGIGPRDVRRATNNSFEGFYIDDIIIGLAERGEMVTGPAANTSFFAVPANPNPAAPKQSLTGPYQLEIRRGQEYGETISGIGSDIVITEQFNTNDRLATGFTLTAPAGSAISDGDTFTLSDGLKSVVFEFDSNSSTITGNRRIIFSSGSSAALMATRIRDAINSAAGASLSTVTAALTDDNITQSNSSGAIRIDLFNAVAVTGISAERTTDRGDRNTIRDQGQIQIFGNSVSHVLQTGIVFDSQRDAGTNLPRPGAPINGPTLNGSRLLPAANISNNVVFDFGTAGIRFEGSGSTTPLGSVPFGRIVNNTIYGRVAPNGVGISVSDNAGPTIMNNIIANTVTGIAIDGSSSASTVVTTTVFQRNTANGTLGTNSISMTSTEPLFVDAPNGNFYLRANSRAIDSSRNSLTERTTMSSVKSPLGIPVSPIVAPAADRYGQLRVDDPAVPNASGLGANIFIDRGAIERADFFRPRARLITPLDNDPAIDGNPALDTVFITSSESLTQIVLQLNDQGVGIDSTTVTSSAFVLRQDGVVLVDGADYQFVYNSNTRKVYFQSVSEFALQSSYTLTVLPNTVADLAGNPLQGNQTDGSALFQIIGNAPPRLTQMTTFPGLKNIALDITYAQLLAASDLLVVSGHPALFRIESVLAGSLEIVKQGAQNAIPATAGTLVEPGDVLTWTPPLDQTGVSGAFTVVGYDPENAQVAPELSVSSPPVTVNVDLVDLPPTLTAIDILDGAVEDTAFEITHQQLLDASDAGDVNHDPISFVVMSVQEGTLQVRFGGGAAVDVVPGVTQIGPGDILVWTPPLNQNSENNSGPLSSFSVVAFDGSSQSSPEIAVLINVTAVPDAPILTQVATLALGGRNSPFKVEFATLLAASDSLNVDGHANEFQITSVPTGATLQIRKAATPTITESAPVGTVVSAGDVLIWTPAAGESGPAVEAFGVVAYDSFNAANYPGQNVDVSDPPVLVTVQVLDEIAPHLTQIATLERPRYVPATITYDDLVANSDLDFESGNLVAFRIENIDQGTILVNGVAANVGTLVFPGDTITWTLTGATGEQIAFDLTAVDQDNTLTSLDPVQVTVNLVNFAPTLTTINTLAIAEQETAFAISYATLLANSNAADRNNDALSFRIESIQSNGTLQLVHNGTTTDALVGTLVAPGDTLIWTPGTGVLGAAIDAFTVKAYDGELASADPAVQVAVFVRAWGSEFSLSGLWTVNGKLARINQNGAALTFVNDAGVGSTGNFIARDRVQATGYGKTATIDLTVADQGRLLWSDGSIWLRISLGGQWVASNQLTSIAQTNDVQLTMTRSNGTQMSGVILSPSTLMITGAGAMGGTFKDGKITFNSGEIWSKLDLSPLYTSSLDGLATQVLQDGTTVLRFVDQFGTTTTGRWTTPTSLIDNGKNRTGTVSNGKIVWSDGETWNKSLTILGTQNGQPTSQSISITATPTTIVASDINGNAVGLRLLSATSLRATTGSLAGQIGTRRDGKIFWQGGTVWENFDFNALNALFADIQSYPRG